MVSGVEERRGVDEEMSSAHILEMNLFTILLRQLKLEDVSPIGRRFTWYHSNDREISWIDRILVSRKNELIIRGIKCCGCLREIYRIIALWC